MAKFLVFLLCGLPALVLGTIQKELDQFYNQFYGYVNVNSAEIYTGKKPVI
jgi:hypothetical protein